MTAYTVTITPDDPGTAVTTIRLDITDSAAAISEVRLTPGAGGALAAGGLPLLDLNNLVAAVVASVVPANPAAVKMSAPAVADEPAEDVAAAPVAPSRTRRKTAGRKEMEPRAATKKAAAKKTAAKSAPKKTAAKAAEPKGAPAKAARPTKAAKKTTSAPEERGSRTYRRVPDDFEQVLRQAGDSARIVADHYGVPRHTAYSWIRSARKKVA
ncbi:hypothetical protein AB0H43_13150 [Hamadaea sp. NPDC050747]|uniref:hypothetical protein n=1 Tax=Hamadaea sp. NPDC050747 TaxID=3155789 RepID=UPI0033F24793